MYLIGTVYVNGHQISGVPLKLVNIEHFLSALGMSIT